MDTDDNNRKTYDAALQAQINSLTTFYSKSNVSLKNLESAAELIKATPGAVYEIPTTHYMLTKSVREASSSIEYFFECFQCNTFTPGSPNIVCVKCNKKINKRDANYFAFIPFEKHLKRVIVKNFDVILNNDEKCKNATDFTDIQCGRIYKQVAAGSIVLSFVLNTDGVNVFQASKKSLWPIQLYQNFLPPSIRFVPENILVVGLYFGSKKPNIAGFILPFAKECRRIYEQNGFNIEHNGRNQHFIPMVTHCSCDLPAKAMIQEFVQYNGYNACAYCKHPGVPVKTQSKKTSSTIVRYIRKANVAIRSHKDTMNTLKKISKSSQLPIDGVKGVSCMIGFKDFDLIDGFCIDYMHCVLLGNVKKLFDCWMNTSFSKKDFHIHKANITELNRRILSIKPVSNISRKPRSLDERRKFKANEYRSHLLYYLRYSLAGLLPMKYIHHFHLLSASIYILSKKTVTNEDIVNAESMLNKFADEFETHYGLDAVSMNLHLLRHIPDAVRNCGPLWTNSLFGFECNNGVLAKSVNGKNRIIEEMTKKHILSRTLNLRKDQTHVCELNQISFIGKGRKKKLNEIEKSIFEKQGISLENFTVCFWGGMKWRNQLFTSLAYRQVKSIDYFVSLSGGSLGTIQYYFKHNNTSYILFEKFEIVTRNDHYLEVNSTSLMSIQKTEAIVEKLLFIKMYSKCIVVRIPNYYEKT